MLRIEILLYGLFVLIYMLDDIVKDREGHVIDSALVKILPSQAVALVRKEMEHRGFSYEIQYGTPVAQNYGPLVHPQFDDSEKELEFLNRWLKPWEKEPQLSLFERALITCGLQEKKEYISTVPKEYDLTLTFIAPGGLTHTERIFIHCQTGKIRECPYYLGDSWDKITPDYVQKHFEHPKLYHIHIIVDDKTVAEKIYYDVRSLQNVCKVEYISEHRTDEENLM